MKSHRYKYLFLYLCLIMLAGLPGQASELIYNRISDDEIFSPYIKELIGAALKSQHPSNPPILKPSQDELLQARALRELRLGGFDIFWTMTSKEREQNLYVLRIPLLKGMLGQRLLAIRKDDSARFNAIKTFADVKKFGYGQGHDWPDADILENAGLHIIRTAAYNNLMKMLEMKRIDAYPLGMNEIWGEIKMRPKLGIIADQNLVLSYNAPVFIFLTSSNLVLQATLEKGFQEIIKNGTFDRLFDKHYKDLILKAKIENRIIFKIKNANMSDKTRQAMKKFSSMLIVQ